MLVEGFWVFVSEELRWVVCPFAKDCGAVVVGASAGPTVVLDHFLWRAVSRKQP